MSFHSSTHKKALASLSQDDTAQLRALLARPVLSHHRQAHQYLRELADVAGARGNLAALQHLVTLTEPLDIQKKLVLAAWSQAVDHQQEAVVLWAQDRLASHHGVDRLALYTHACRSRHWRGAGYLLDHGVPAGPEAAKVAVWPMCSSVQQPHLDRAAMTPVAERLMPYFALDHGPQAVLVAMKLQLNDGVTHHLNRARHACAQDEALRRVWMQEGLCSQEAVAQQRLDWLTTLDQVQQRPGFWATQMQWTVTTQSDLNLPIQILNARGDQLPRLHETLGALAVTVSQVLNRHDPVDLRVRDLVRRLIEGWDVDALRQDLTTAYRAHLPNQVIGDDALNRKLNRLFLCVDSDIQQRWYAEDPTRFAPGLARVREEQAQRGDLPAARRHDRLRS